MGKEVEGEHDPLPQRTISSVKRKMGSHFRYEIDGENYPPEYIGALIFRQLLTIAKSQTNIDFTEAVVSVPANFTDGQRYAIKDARGNCRIEHQPHDKRAHRGRACLWAESG